MLIPTLLLAIMYFVLNYVEATALGWQAFSRPIVICPLAGIILGDVYTGCVLGAALESVFMGISVIGGAMPADPSSTSYIVTALVILTGAEMESAVALAMPIAVILGQITMLPFSLLAPVQGFLTQTLQKNKVKTFEITAFAMTAVQPLLSSIILFASIYFGVEGIQVLMASVPAWVMTGLGAVSSMALAVGFAILTSQIMSKEIIVWFFVGFVLVKFLSLDIIAIAVIGTAVAVTVFFLEKKIAEGKNKETEEEFF